MLVTRRKMLGLSAATMGALALGRVQQQLGDSGNGGGEGSDHAGTLVASTSGLEGKFCPLFTASAADQDVVSFNNITLLAVDRMAEPIYNGIEGETKEYNGTEYTYTAPANVEMVENADGSVNYNISCATTSSSTTAPTSPWMTYHLHLLLLLRPHLRWLRHPLLQRHQGSRGLPLRHVHAGVAHRQRRP